MKTVRTTTATTTLLTPVPSCLVCQQKVVLNKNNRVSDAYVEDGSYIRLQNIALSYTLPRKWLSHTFLNNVKLYCNVQNVFTITKYDGFDPEVGSMRGNALLNGVDYSRYPSPRIYTFGVNVQF